MINIQVNIKFIKIVKPLHYDRPDQNAKHFNIVEMLALNDNVNKNVKHCYISDDEIIYMTEIIKSYFDLLYRRLFNNLIIFESYLFKFN